MEKLVLVACDSMANAAAIMRCFSHDTMSHVSIVSSTRILDAVKMTNSFQPALVIFGFRNNSGSLNQYIRQINNPDIPIICLTRGDKDEQLHKCKHKIIFPYPSERLSRNPYLHTTAQSIFQLHKQTTSGRASDTVGTLKADSHRTLSRYVMELDQKQKVLEQVKQRISELFPVVDDPTRVDLMSIANSIKLTTNDKKLWDDFTLYFEKIDPGFISTITKRHPELTSKDLKYCCYLKMNMSNADIQNLLGINQESVRTHKYRLKKKLSLARDEKLKNYVRSIG